MRVNALAAALVLILSLLLFASTARSSDILMLEPIDASRAQLILQDSVAKSNSRWYQFQAGGSIYDARRETLVGRWSPGFQFGRRFENTGVFLNIELDQTFDLTQDIRRLDVLHFGAGLEVLHFLGRVRSTISVGAAVLRTDTDIDSKGKTGWYIDFRPAALRWAWGRFGTIEIAPLALDVSVPVSKGIPLVLFSYFTVFSVEWAEQIGAK